MTLDRRTFVATAASLAAAAVAQPSGATAMPTAVAPGDDPLGVRGDFPIVTKKAFLNSAYIAPIPKQVVAAGLAFLEEKANNSYQLGPLLRKCDEVRAQFARLIRAASADEIGLLFSTAEGENVVEVRRRVALFDCVRERVCRTTNEELAREPERRQQDPRDPSARIVGLRVSVSEAIVVGNFALRRLWRRCRAVGFGVRFSCDQHEHERKNRQRRRERPHELDVAVHVPHASATARLML